ncbi:MAG: hypothetical protein J0L97_08330, partial [Alphaproteobacteria bacterium]|nr:hypothetical protein [Alphaproteobacteria bacterium]
FEAAAMYVQRVVMPAATWLAQETEGFREQGWGLHAHLEDTLTRLKEDVLPGLEAQFAQHCPVLPDGRRTGVVFTLSQGQAESVMRRD